MGSAAAGKYPIRYKNMIPDTTNSILVKKRFHKGFRPLWNLGFLAGAEGLEPSTNGFGDRYSTN